MPRSGRRGRRGRHRTASAAPGGNRSGRPTARSSASTSPARAANRPGTRLSRSGGLAVQPAPRVPRRQRRRRGQGSSPAPGARTRPGARQEPRPPPRLPQLCPPPGLPPAGRPRGPGRHRDPPSPGRSGRALRTPRRPRGRDSGGPPQDRVSTGELPLPPPPAPPGRLQFLTSGGCRAFGAPRESSVLSSGGQMHLRTNFCTSFRGTQALLEPDTHTAREGR